MAEVDAIPADVLAFLRDIFGDCNARVTRKLSMAPNIQEESLDHTWIESLSHRSSPTTLVSDWTVRIESHYLGGLRHFRSWEIADIGVLVFIRFPDGTQLNKVALLQSKRLYPTNAPVREETAGDYVTGIARLADPESQHLSITLARDYCFADASRYQALNIESNQAGAIRSYQQMPGFRVYYQLYNPWRVPFEQRIPLTGYTPPAGEPDLGVRVIPASVVHGLVLPSKTPCLADLASLDGLPGYGWRLEQFVCDEVLSCREGDQFTRLEDDAVQSLFYRRSGPISAAISITIEAPTDAEAA